MGRWRREDNWPIVVMGRGGRRNIENYNVPSGFIKVKNIRS